MLGHDPRIDRSDPVQADAEDRYLAGFSRETMLHYHLQHNHYPPLSVELIPFAVKAIEMADDGDWGGVITLPHGEGTKTLVKPDGSEATVAELIGDLHLEGFIDNQEDE